MRACSAAFVYYKNKLLLLQRDDIPTIPFPGYWDIIGGVSEENELPLQTLHRELLEEIHVNPKNTVFLTTVVRKDSVVASYYQVILSTEEMESIKKGDEGQALAFFDVSELKSIKLVPLMKSLLDKYPQDLSGVAMNAKNLLLAFS